MAALEWNPRVVHYLKTYLIEYYSISTGSSNASDLAEAGEERMKGRSGGRVSKFGEKISGFAE